LKARGYHIATAKHTHRDMTTPESDKDSDRHLKAGSEASLIIDPHGLMMIQTITDDISIEQVAQLIGEDYDLILTEGFKEDDAPKLRSTVKKTLRHWRVSRKYSPSPLMNRWIPKPAVPAGRCQRYRRFN